MKCEREAQTTTDGFGTAYTKHSGLPVWSATAKLLAKMIKTEPPGANR